MTKDMPCAGCGAPVVSTPDELCFHCEGAEASQYDDPEDEAYWNSVVDEEIARREGPDLPRYHDEY